MPFTGVTDVLRWAWGRLVIGSAALLAPAHSVAQDVQSESLSVRIDSIFAQFTGPGSPGCAVAVSGAGVILHSRAYGLANLEDTVPLTPRSAFYAASISKEFTGAAVALLIAEKRVGLEDDVRRYLPELPDYGRMHGRAVRVRHLLHHTSGIRDYDALFDLAGWPADGVYRSDEVMALLARQHALNFAPGAEYAYSSSGYFLLGEIVRRVSGKSLRAFAEERIFLPLGMTRTVFRDDHTLVVPARAIGYAPREGGGYRLAQPNFDLVGGGGAMTTVKDLMRWSDNLYHARVGGPELVARVTTPGALDNGDPVPYGFGVFVTDHDGRPLLSHPGGYLGYQGALLRFPTERLAIAALCNLESSDAYAYALRIADLYFRIWGSPGASGPPAAADSSAGPAEVILSPAQLDRWAGVYRNPETEELRRVSVIGGRLQQQLDPFTQASRLQTLVPVAPGRFRVEDGPIEVRFGSSTAHRGGPRLTVVRPGRQGSAADEFVQEPFVSPARLQPERYLGTYTSAELEVRYRVVQLGDSLTLIGPNGSRRALRPTFADAFISADGWILRFRPGHGPRPQEFVLTTERIRRLLFRRVGS